MQVGKTLISCTSSLIRAISCHAVSLQYSEICVREPPLRMTSAIDVERWLSYKGTCHVILLAKLQDMYLYKTDDFSISTTILSQSQRWLSYTGFTVSTLSIQRARLE